MNLWLALTNRARFSVHVQPLNSHYKKGPRVKSGLLGCTLLHCRIMSNLQQTCKSAIFVIRPTSVRVWHKTVFKVGPVAGPWPRCVKQFQEFLGPRRHSPFWVRLRCQVINLIPRGGWKPERGLRPEVYPGMRHTRANRAPRNTASRNVSHTRDSHAKKSAAPTCKSASV